MTKNEFYYLDELIKRYPSLEKNYEDIKSSYLILKSCFESGHKLLVAGNGGSASDSEHIVGELMKSFKLKRPCPSEIKNKILKIDSENGKNIIEAMQGALPVISLTNQTSLNTAYINDIIDGANYVFAQQVYGYGNDGDVFLAISTSGNSENIVNASIVAKAKNIKVIGLTGNDGGLLLQYCEKCIIVPEKDAYLVQELHLPIYHCLCLMLENYFFE